MTDEEKKAINIIKEFKDTGYASMTIRYNRDAKGVTRMIENSLKTILNLIEKQEKIIDKMIEHIVRVIINDDNACLLPFCDNEDNLEEKVKKYFYREVKDE